MLSPHSALRQRNLFAYAVDTDRERRHLGLPDTGPEVLYGRKLKQGESLMDTLKAGIQAAVTARVYGGR
jgi:hypothetical protein